MEVQGACGVRDVRVGGPSAFGVGRRGAVQGGPGREGGEEGGEEGRGVSAREERIWVGRGGPRWSRRVWGGAVPGGPERVGTERPPPAAQSTVGPSTPSPTPFPPAPGPPPPSTKRRWLEGHAGSTRHERLWASGAERRVPPQQSGRREPPASAARPGAAGGYLFRSSPPLPQGAPGHDV